MSKSAYLTELRAEEVQELLGKTPHWLLRWGSTLALLVLSLLGGGAYLVRYPDLVRATIKLTASNAPKAVLTRTDGRLVRLFVRDGDTVPVGQVLGYLESTARHADVLRLSRQLAQAWALASRGELDALPRLNLSNYGQLGELQSAYQPFEQAQIHLRAYLANGFYSQKKAMLRQDIRDLQALAISLQQQRTMQARDVQLAQEDYSIQHQVADQTVTAPLDLIREESKIIARQLPYQQTGSSLINNLTIQRTKQKEILELDQQVAEERATFLLALTTLQSAIAAWKAKYVVTAPIGGQIFFSSTLQENQTVSLNQELLLIAPPATDYYGELRIPQQNAGKVAVNQAVLVKFAGFPYYEFGAVRGRIATIANVSLNDSVFLAKVVFPHGLRTTYGKSVPFKSGMMASAEIITADTRLLQKLFYQLRKVANGG